MDDDKLTGHVWNEHTGWINLYPSDSVYVAHDGNGNLSGHAWGEGIGYIDFSGVTIDSEGFFHGYAYSPVTGQISFNCLNTASCADSNFKVKTFWQPNPSPPPPPPSPPSSGGGGGGGSGGGGGGGGQPQTPVQPTSPTSTTPLPTGTYATTTITQRFSDPAARCPYFLTALSRGMTHPEVRLMQSFLMYYGFMPQGTTTTFFDDRTLAAVRMFQLANAESILTPWGMTQPSGWWYITTRKRANELVDCVTTGTLRIALAPGSTLNVRTRPAIPSPIVSRVRGGQEYKYYAQNNGWYYIDYAPGQSGWISGQYVSIVSRSALE